MKKILFSLVILVSICTSSQSKILEEGKTWTLREFAPLAKDTFYEYTVDGDTILNDTTAVKLRGNAGQGDFYFYVHEEDGKIWLYKNWDGLARYQLIVDFNLTLGIVSDNSVEVLDESIMEIEGVSRRVLSVAYQGWVGMHSYWIEGVGITTQDVYLSPIAFIMGHRTELLSCHLNGQCVFSKENFDKMTGIESIAVDSSEGSPMHDLRGMPVANPRKRGLYIKDGKKIIW